MRLRGLGRVFQTVYKDPRTGQARRTKTWYIEYVARGQRRRESTGSPHRADAITLLKQRLAEITQGRLLGPDAERTTFDDLAALLIGDYIVNGRKSLDRARFSVNHLRTTFGALRATGITTELINAYIRARQNAGAAQGTIQNELAALKRMFNLGVQAGKIVRRPHIPHIEVRNTRTGFFDEHEYRAVQMHLPEHLRPLVSFLYLTGWRKGEALDLQWRRVDFQAGVIRLEPGSTKNDGGRTFPFQALPPLAQLIHDQWRRAVPIAGNPAIPWVFHREGRPIKEFRKTWEKACQAAGVPGRLLHDFRRTAVRNLERAGVPRSVAMKLTGHRTESVYRRYAIVSEADLSLGVARLAALHENTITN